MSRQKSKRPRYSVVQNGCKECGCPYRAKDWPTRKGDGNVQPELRCRDCLKKRSNRYYENYKLRLKEKGSRPLSPVLPASGGTVSPITNLPVPTLPSKPCPGPLHQGKALPLNRFGRSKCRSNGLQSWCVECRATSSKISQKRKRQRTAVMEAFKEAEAALDHEARSEIEAQMEALYAAPAH